MTGVSKVPSLLNSPIRRMMRRRPQRTSGSDEADAVDALQILSGRKRSNPQQLPAPRKRCRE